MKTAQATINGFAATRALRKSRAAIFDIARDIPGEARLVERAFDLGALAETMPFVGARLEPQAAGTKRTDATLACDEALKAVSSGRDEHRGIQATPWPPSAAK